MTYAGKDHVAQYGAFQEIDVHDRFKVVLGEVFGIQRVFPFVNADVDDVVVIYLLNLHAVLIVGSLVDLSG